MPLQMEVWLIENLSMCNLYFLCTYFFVKFLNMGPTYRPLLVYEISHVSVRIHGTLRRLSRLTRFSQIHVNTPKLSVSIKPTYHSVCLTCHLKLVTAGHGPNQLRQYDIQMFKLGFFRSHTGLLWSILERKIWHWKWSGPGLHHIPLARYPCSLGFHCLDNRCNYSGLML